MAKTAKALIWFGIITGLVLLPACQTSATCDPADVQISEIVYKRTPQGDLRLHVHQCGEGADRPVIVFFFGGGWVGGNPRQFFPHCRQLAALGMVAVSAEYRVRNRHGTTPFECVADGKSAIRYLRAHAAELGIDPDRVVAAGGSAGGHVAACTVTIAACDEDSEDITISSKPNALVLFNPVVDTTKLGYGANRFKDDPRKLSPVHHIREELPPTMIFHGTADTTVPFENVERFCREMHEAGNECTLIPFEGKKHGFFNYGRDEDNRSYHETVAQMDEFLGGHGFLQ
ncbi:MAG: alpha/beta hydrolase [Phycisphaerales bacterium]|nr:MAG: alpha/beta hydrolase [Phycisphaerales bacterium]